MEKSAIAEHAWTKHHPEWDSISILDQPRNNRLLLVKEALHISLAGQHMLLNRDQGTAISDCWRPLLRCATCQSRLDPTSQLHPSTWTRNFHLWTLDLTINKDLVWDWTMLWRRLQHSSQNISFLSKVFRLEQRILSTNKLSDIISCQLISEDRQKRGCRGWVMGTLEAAKLLPLNSREF